MNSRVFKLLAAGAAAGALTAGAVASDAAGPPFTTANGQAVQQVAAGTGNTATAFAFGAGHIFVSEVPGGSTPAGVYVLGNGTATRLTNGPAVASGVAWHQNALYVGTDTKLLRMSGWNGHGFNSVKTLYTAPKKFTGFDGLGFGANGRLYVGVSLAETNDHGKPSTPYEYDMLSFTSAGKDLKVVATGLRQPWQMAFPAHSSAPLVSDLNQDKPNGIKAPDFLVRIKSGQAYGFPNCNWATTKPCKGYAKPVRFFSPHTDPMGIAISGKTVYLVTGFASSTHSVLAFGVNGGKAKTVVTSSAAPLVGLGIHGGYLYLGDVVGDVYRTKL
jgi:hypothetical protein